MTTPLLRVRSLMVAALLVVGTMALCSSVSATVSLSDAVKAIPPQVSTVPTINQPQFDLTDEDLRVVAVWENGPLWLGDELEARIHYPVEGDAANCTRRGCTNGCTIGAGYNLGAHSRLKVRADLRAAGVSEDRIRYFVRLAGKTGLEAVALCGKDVLTGNEPTLTRPEALALLRRLVAEHKTNVVLRADAEGVLGKLSAGQLAILVALDYQNPVLSSDAIEIWVAIKEDNWSAVANIIRRHSGSQLTHALQRRRDWEASYWIWATNRRTHYLKHHTELPLP